jgi:hypothetical protein
LAQACAQHGVSRRRACDRIDAYTLSQPICDVADDDEASFHLFGQAAALNREIRAAELVVRLVEDAFAVLARFGSAT